MNKKLALAVASSLLSTASFAQVAVPWDRPFTLQIGALRADASTGLRLDSEIGGGTGTQVSLEGTLGVTATDTLPTFDFLWRLNSRHALEGSYVTLDRSGNRTIDLNINWGEATFPINTTVNSSFKSDTFRVAYRYSPINDQGNELALLLGLHYTKMEATINSAVGTASDSATVDFPLPTIGIRGSARFAETLRVTGFAQMLKLEIDEYDGELVNYGVGLEWAFMPQAYVGVGYLYYKYDLKSEKANSRGQFNYTFDGPTVYLGWAF